MSRYGGAPERWDRSRFEAASRGPPVRERDPYETASRGPPVRERDPYETASRGPPVRERDSYEEVDYYHREREREPEREPPPRRTVLREQERYDYVPRREYYYEEAERDPYEGALVHRPREQRDVEIDISRREYDRYEPRRESERPRFVRRQSSLDTHDRRPMPRYGDRPTEEVVFVPSSGRRRSSVRYDDYEDIKVADPAYYGDETFRGYREREVERYRRRRSPSPASSASGSGGGTEIIEEREEIIEKEYPRKGKTKMPLRLVNKRAIIKLGYSFEEHGETVIILRALGKEHIDEVIKLSKEMNEEGAVVEETKKTTYVYEKHSRSPSRDGTVIEERREIIREGSPAGEMSRSVRDWDQMSASRRSSKSKARSPSPSESASTIRSKHRSRHHSRHSRHSHRARSHSTGTSPHRAIILEEREESATLKTGIGALDGSAGALVIQQKPRRRQSKSISKEIALLQAERRALQLERESDELQGRSRGGEIIIAREKNEAVEVVKDKKAPDPRIIRAMLATLT